MIVSRDDLRLGEIVVQGDPPAVGSTHWVRHSLHERPACHIEIVESWPLKDSASVVRFRRVSKPHVDRKPPPPSKLRLSQEQRNRILAGSDQPLLFDEKPDVEPGYEHVVLWSRATRIVDEEYNVTQIPREPMVVLVVTSVRETPEKKWLLRFRRRDHRPERVRLLRRVPPVYADAETARDDQARLEAGGFDQLQAEGREESHYTSDPRSAGDELEAIDDESLTHLPDWSQRRATEQRKVWVRERAKIERAIDRLESDASMRQMLGGELRVLRRRLEAIDRRLTQKAA